MNFSLLTTRALNIIILIILILLIITLISQILSLLKIDVTKYTITSKKIPAAFNNYKILQLSDLHNVTFGKDNSRLLEKIRKLNPDIITMTGDMVNTNSKDYSNFFNLAKEISKNYSCYYIMGNHEIRLPKDKQLEITKTLSDLGINVLNNESGFITKDNEYVMIYGLTQPADTYKNALKDNISKDFLLSDMKEIFPVVNKEDFNILLSHSPFDFEVFEKWGADLVFSGHVHGGLIRLPFVGGLLSPERTFFPKYDAGEYGINNSKMIVSRGLGNGTINLRIFNNPEICLIELTN